MNGRNNNRNGTQHNGRTQVSTKIAPSPASEATSAPEANSKVVRADAFDQPVILQQTNFWSRAIVWGIVGAASFGLIWASVAQIEEAVPATGQLKPQSQVQPVQAPVGGVVEELYVKDGQAVKKGDVLIRLDPTAAEAQQRSLEQKRTSLMRQNQFYRSQLSNSGAASTAEAQKLNLPPEIQALASNRSALLAENQLYQAQLSGSTDGLTPEQRVRVQAGLLEANSRESAARLDVSQLQQQLSQTRSQLSLSKKSLEIEEKIYKDLSTLLAQGGIQRLQVVQQEQKVLDNRTEVDKLEQEEKRLQYAIDQAQEKFQNSVALTATDLLNKIAENSKRIAEIDSQFNKAVVDNENLIADINSQLSETEVTLKYQELRAPVDGIVFDLQAKGTGFVATNSEPILKIVPNNALVAEVFVTNKDIGFVNTGMPVDVRVDSFPFSEFGDIHGTLSQIGSDALPPDQEHPFYRFPAKVAIDKQFIAVNGKEIPLQSGMSITANIITRKRSVMSIFTDMFSRKVDSIKTVR